jgi:hypothetical protein
MILHTETHPTRDHTIPASKGGTVLVHCCYQCNQIKADMMPEQWTVFMAENPEWWLKRPVTPPKRLPTFAAGRRNWPWLDNLQKWCRDNSADANTRGFFRS